MIKIQRMNLNAIKNVNPVGHDIGGPSINKRRIILKHLKSNIKYLNMN